MAWLLCGCELLGAITVSSSVLFFKTTGTTRVGGVAGVVLFWKSC